MIVSAIGRNAQPGVERREPEHLLEVQRAQVPHREQRRAEQQHDPVGDVERLGQLLERDQRVGREARLDHHERQRAARGRRGSGRAPAARASCAARPRRPRRRGPSARSSASARRRGRSCGRASPRRRSATTLHAISAVTTPIGGLISSTQRQLMSSVMIPPNSVPAAPPAPFIAAHSPIARCSCGPGRERRGDDRQRGGGHERAAEALDAAGDDQHLAVVERPPTSDVIANKTSAATNTRRCPS